MCLWLTPEQQVMGPVGFPAEAAIYATNAAVTATTSHSLGVYRQMAFQVATEMEIRLDKVLF